jgi:hypothetical protein
VIYHDTNRYVLDRLNCFPGEVRLLKVEGGEFRIAREFRYVIRRLLREAGKNNPAFWRFKIHNGVGYLIPQGVTYRARTEEKNAN